MITKTLGACSPPGDAPTLRRQRRRISATSSRRWRSDRPPIVLLGEILHCDEDLVDLHSAVLGDGQQQVEHLRRLQIVGRLEQQLVDRLAASLEVALELRSATTDVVGALERLHALHERTLRRRDGLRGRFADRRHGRRLYILAHGPIKPNPPQFDSTSSLRSSIVEDGSGNNLRLQGVLRDCIVLSSCEQPAVWGDAGCHRSYVSSRRRYLRAVRAARRRSAGRPPGRGSSRFRPPQMSAPTRIRSSASRPLWTPPMPTIGIVDASRDRAHLGERDRRGPPGRTRHR